MYEWQMNSASKNVRVVGWRREDDEIKASDLEKKIRRKQGKGRNFPTSISIRGKNEQHSGGSSTNEETRLGKLSCPESAHRTLKWMI